MNCSNSAMISTHNWRKNNMDKASDLGYHRNNQIQDLAESRPDKLYSLLHAHQLAHHRGRFYYCFDSARIYNQYKELGMEGEYYETMTRVRVDLRILGNKDRKRRNGSIVSQVFSK